MSNFSDDNDVDIYNDDFDFENSDKSQLSKPTDDKRRRKKLCNTKKNKLPNFYKILLTQMIICIIIIGGAFFVKFYSKNLFFIIKEQTLLMINESTVVDNLFKKIDEYTNKIPFIKDFFESPLEKKTKDVLNSLEQNIASQNKTNEPDDPQSNDNSENSNGNQNNDIGGVGISVSDDNRNALPENVSFSSYSLSKTPTIPVEGKITSGFDFRINPITNENEFHPAVDIAAEKGTKIKAFLSGEVFKINENKIFGKNVLIKHSETTYTFYAHLDKIFVENNFKIRQGETIGLVGSTGFSTGSHLHFEIIIQNKKINPEYVLKSL